MPGTTGLKAAAGLTGYDMGLGVDTLNRIAVRLLIVFGLLFLASSEISS